MLIGNGSVNYLYTYFNLKIFEIKLSLHGEFIAYLYNICNFSSEMFVTKLECDIVIPNRQELHISII